MDEVRTKKIEIEVNQDKIDYINYANSEEVTYWRKGALERVSIESAKRELIDLALSRVSLIRKVKSVKTVNINEIIFYLKSTYSAHNEEPRIFINDILSEEPSFEAMTSYLKTFSKFIKEDENTSLKNKYLIGGWILMASKIYRRENLSYRFEDWLYCLCKIKRQTSYNDRNLFKLMNVAPKLINYRVNTTYFVKNHEILLKYFDELETQTPWKHVFSCTCED